MRIIGVQRRVSPFLIAVVLLQLSPALAAGQPDAQQATIQGSRFPGMPVPSKETTKNRRRGPEAARDQTAVPASLIVVQLA